MLTWSDTLLLFLIYCCRLVQNVTLVNFHILSEFFSPNLNCTWLCIIFLICDWVRFSGILLRIFMYAFILAIKPWSSLLSVPSSGLVVGSTAFTH